MSEREYTCPPAVRDPNGMRLSAGYDSDCPTHGEPTPESEDVVGNTAEQVSEILRRVLDGTGKQYRVGDGFVRWGLVERDILAAIHTLQAENERLRELGVFVEKHENCDPAGPSALWATDIAPNVLRLDCLKCGDNVQIPRKALTGEKKDD